MLHEPGGADREGPRRDDIDRRRLLFEDRYGADWHDRLATLLQQPCVSFAKIASVFGVTRERVRQWQVQFFPEAPHGERRRALCKQRRQRRRVLSDPLFAAFYRHARVHLGTDGLQLIASASGFRTRLVRINGQVVALRRLAAEPRAGASPRFRGRADYVYFLLPGGEFVFTPARQIGIDPVVVRNSFGRFPRAQAAQEVS